MTPCWGNTILFRSSQQLPHLSIGLLKGSMSRHGALQGPSTWTCTLLPELQRQRDAVGHVALEMDGPGHCQEHMTQTLT